MTVIDLRSDTLTRPDAAMLRAMVSAPAGDDNYGEDVPTNELEERCADLFGTEAAVFMTTGTLSNQIALRVHTRPGDEVVIDESYHLNTYESAPSADLAGISLTTVRTPDGVLTPEHLVAALDSKCRDERYAQPALVSMENTINYRSGRVVPLEAMQRVHGYAKTAGLGVHLDGARLFNASVATGSSLRSYGAVTDTVAVCFSKGLGAPFGSILAGPNDLMRQARYYRKSYGGALHQGGYLAAAASYALDHNVDRLAEDHRAARVFADLVHGHPLVEFDRDEVHTNIVIVDVRRTGVTAECLVDRLADAGVLAVATSPRHVRFVTRMGITACDARAAAGQLLRLLDSLGPVPSHQEGSDRG